jgi:hypothetical protein
MFLESFRKLSVFDNLSNYQYIGFGGNFFTEYVLIHKELHIDELYSIERDIGNKKRFEFNKPFDLIKMNYKTSGNALSDYCWKKKTIIWLDYDSKFNFEMLEDVRTVASQICSGSILIITCNTHLGPEDERMDYMIKEFGERLPYGISDRDLSPANSYKTTYQMIKNEIEETVSRRKKINEKYKFEQLYYYIYSDIIKPTGSKPKMLTYGVIVVESKDQEKLDIFNNCSVINKEAVPIEIDVPLLTFKEMQYLNGIIDNIEDDDRLGLEEKELQAYKKFYKYYPFFSEIII